MSNNKPISVNITDKNIMIVFEGLPPYTIRRTDDEDQQQRYDLIKAKIVNAYENNTDENWEEIRSLFAPVIKKEDIYIDKDHEKRMGKNGIVFKDGNFYYKGYKLKNYLIHRILEIKKESEMTNQPFKHLINPLVMFLENLMKNPSNNSVAQLYRFVEHTKLPITEDGCILAYKIVTHDYKDKHSKSINNKVGAKPWMPRNEVDDNPHQTCSSGYHFCSYKYATGFFNSGNDRMVVIKVNPADVVSIPVDYNNEKGRCCQYEVLYEIPMEEVRKEDVLRINRDDNIDFDEYDPDIDDDFFNEELDELYCPHCGEELSEDDNFCPDCGEEL